MGSQRRDGGADRPARRLFKGKKGRRDAMFSVREGLFGGHGMSGQGSARNRIAFDKQIPRHDNVSTTYLGDGAANQGQVYRKLQQGKAGSYGHLHH